MANPSLKIGGIDLSIVGWLDYEQSIEPISGSTTRRMGGGSAFKLTHWRKYRVSISAGGWIPPALLGINYDEPFEIELPAPVALNVGESLPAGWSSRVAPYDEHTVTDQEERSVRYVYPKLTVVAEPPSQSNGNSAAPSWNLVMEQV